MPAQHTELVVKVLQISRNGLRPASGLLLVTLRFPKCRKSPVSKISDVWLQ